MFTERCLETVAVYRLIAKQRVYMPQYYYEAPKFKFATECFLRILPLALQAYKLSLHIMHLYSSTAPVYNV
jgi:hypothetical protein